MKKYLLVTLASLSITLGACSKKTTAPTSNTNVSQERSARGGQGQRQGRPDFSTLLEQMDSNGDGQLSQEETRGRLKEQFAEVDKDNNGLISKEEFDSAPKPQRGGGRGRN